MRFILCASIVAACAPSTGAETGSAADADRDGSPSAVDCDDSDPSVYPGAPEICGDDRVTDCRLASEDGVITLDGTSRYPDLQSALDAAADGSEIRLCPGTYSGTFTAAAPVRLVGHAGAAATVLEGDGDSVLAVRGGSELAGLTVRGGDALYGGGVQMISFGTLLVEGSVLTANRASYGAGLYVWPSSAVTLLDTQVVGNDASHGGGGVMVSQGGSLALSGASSIADNTAVVFGGGVWLQEAELVGGVITGNAVTEAASYLYGGTGVVFDGDALGGGGVAMTGTSTVTSAQILANQGTGAGVSVTRGAGTLVDTVVTGNDADGTFGGGVAVLAGSLALSGGAVDGNAADLGGGVALVASTLEGGSITANTARHGGGVHAAYPSAVTGALLADNTADTGGGVYVEQEALTVSGGAVVRSAAGGGAFVEPGAELAVVSADFGTGADDNTPVDVSAGGTDYAGYGAAATFTCADAGCAPAP